MATLSEHAQHPNTVPRSARDVGASGDPGDPAQDRSGPLPAIPARHASGDPGATAQDRSGPLPAIPARHASGATARGRLFDVASIPRTGSAATRRAIAQARAALSVVAAERSRNAARGSRRSRLPRANASSPLENPIKLSAGVPDNAPPASFDLARPALSISRQVIILTLKKYGPDNLKGNHATH